MQGKEIHGYKIVKPLGKGGMAEVWLAENRLGKKAAVKIMLNKFIDEPKVIQRFENEAKAMITLEHPLIRQVIDLGYVDQKPAIIMEYLEGETLAEYIKNNSPNKHQLQHWWKQCLEALFYVHQKGVIHRDIKPSNIFLCNNGKIKLLDFGIAKIREEASITTTGQGIGTLIYMSPEQVKNSKEVSAPTDIYALGITFYQLIAKKVPFVSTESDYEILNCIVKGRIDWDAIPNTWREILKNVTQIESSARPTASELLNEKPKEKDFFEEETKVVDIKSDKSVTKSESFINQYYFDNTDFKILFIVIVFAVLISLLFVNKIKLSFFLNLI